MKREKSQGFEPMISCPLGMRSTAVLKRCIYIKIMIDRIIFLYSLQFDKMPHRLGLDRFESEYNTCQLSFRYSCEYEYLEDGEDELYQFLIILFYQSPSLYQNEIEFDEYDTFD